MQEKFKVDIIIEKFKMEIMIKKFNVEIGSSSKDLLTAGENYRVV